MYEMPRTSHQWPTGSLSMQTIAVSASRPAPSTATSLMYGLNLSRFSM